MGWLAIKAQPERGVVLTLPDGRMVTIRAERAGKLAIDAPRDVLIAREQAR